MFTGCQECLSVAVGQFLHKIQHAVNYAIILGNIKAVFNVHGSVHRKNMLVYIQQDATLHSLFYLETALHVAGGGTTTRNM